MLVNQFLHRAEENKNVLNLVDESVTIGLCHSTQSA